MKPVYIFGFDYGNANPSAIPVLCDQSGVLLAGVPSQSGGAGTYPHIAGFFQANADGVLAASYGVTGISLTYGYDPTSGNWDRIQTLGNNADANAVSNTGQFATLSHDLGFNGSTWDRVRVANVFHSAVATAVGATAVWTPTVGKFFRLMGYTISVSGTLAAAGTQVLQLLDAAAIIKRHNATVQSVITGDTQIGADLGNGQLSAAVNNVLNINLGTAMATGSVAVNVWGTEE